MRQVTGSKSSPRKFRVSIQQSLDGHSFSRPGLDDCQPSEETVEVELLLPKTMLVPEAICREELAAELLAANGMPARSDESIVICPAGEGVKALAAFDDQLRRQILEKFPGARFSTPLAHRPDETTRCVWVCRRESLLYAKVYRDGALQLAEVIPAAEEAEIGYFIERLASCFPLAEYELRIAGDEPKKLRKWFGNAFKKVLCES